ncbi:hypothetical protein K466DRAFT_553843 [Polyporus arcularius HHB13444]|uniref:Uncharacterized protein n=1 Tax=Polyporus arcularius HHB13444 TaxID=1314778 RepID=A0A5C3P6N7_9APHY|nr:hypothetical protein K466DRAFT_553843 [Polyporus arcularius HHB13444]
MLSRRRLFKQCRHAYREPVRVPSPRRSIRRSSLPRSSLISRAIEAVGLGADLTTCISSDYSIWTLVADATVNEVASQLIIPTACSPAVQWGVSGLGGSAPSLDGEPSLF